VSKTNHNHPQARTWRDITQQVKPRAMSRSGRRRMTMTFCRITAAVLVIGLLLGSVVVFTELFQDHPRKIASAVNAVPVKDIAMRTDGVLDQAWLTQTLALSPRATLMELDLEQLRDRLLADDQVLSATVARKFPATLEVSLSERSPVALVNAQLGNAAPRPLQVARDGVVYAGRGYHRDLLESLPFLDGVKLVKQGGRLQPISGMDVVARLLATARNEAPHLYKSWRVISLARLESDAELEVRAANIERIIFQAQSATDFLRQIAQLDVLIDSIRAQADQPVGEINLALGRMTDGRIQVPVSFKDPVVGPAQPTIPRPAVTQFFQPTHSTNREL